MYSCTHNDDPCCIKLFKQKEVLKHERKVLTLLKREGLANFPKPLNLIKYKGLDGILTNRFGNELDYYHRQRDQMFSIEKVNQLGVQLVTLLEQFHSIGFVYADLKPDNLLVGDYGQTEKRELKLIDFGMARSYLETDEHGNKVHIKAGKEKQSGNLAFASPNSVFNLKLSRRDDLISLVLMLSFLVTGNIP